MRFSFRVIQTFAVASFGSLLAITSATAQVIRNVSVTATSWWDDQIGEGSIQWVGNLTNNSGLSAPSDVTATHGFDNNGTHMWHAKTWAVDPNPTVTFTLGGAFDLKGIHIWNGNQALNLAHIRRGVNSFQLSVSKDGGMTYTSVGTYNLIVSPLPGVQISAQNFDLTGQDGVTHVKMRVMSTHNSPAGGGDYASLSEVMFTAFLVPDVLQLTRFEVGDGKVTLAWPSVGGQVFDIFRSADLVTGFDVPLVSGLVATGGAVAVTSLINDFSGLATLGDSAVNFSEVLAAGTTYVFVPATGESAGREVAVVSWTGNTVTLAEDLASDLSWTGGYKIQTPVKPETVWIDTAPPAGKAFYKVNRR